jgi:hypothetical protein
MFLFGQKTSVPTGISSLPLQPMDTESSEFSSAQPMDTEPSGFCYGQNSPLQPAASGIFPRLDTQPQQPLCSGSSNNGFNNYHPSVQNINNYQQPSIQPAKGNASGMFNFGSNSEAPASIQSVSLPSNVFGGNLVKNVSSPFTCNPSTGIITNNSAPNVFGQDYQYRGQPNNTASFTFGGSSSNSVPTAPQSGFNLTPESAPVTGSAFNFQGQQPILAPQPSSSNGLFNIGTGGNLQQRPIRYAMRRMK